MKQFSESIKSLELIENYTEPYDKVVEQGILTLFRTCFDNSIRIMQVILTNQGYGSTKLEFPKIVIEASVNLGLIKAEKAWFDLLNNIIIMNKLSSDQVRILIRKIKNKYLQMFKSLEQDILDDWLDDINIEMVESVTYRSLSD